MNAKETKIKEAWAGFYNPQVDMENGWMDVRPGTYSNDQFFDRLKFNSEKHSIRPKTLSGIENNNGWVKIESEDDLPKSYNSLYDVCNNQNVDTIPMTLHQVKYLYENKKITHYQKHNKKLPPLY